MFDQLIKVGQLLVTSLSIPLLQPNKKRLIGNKLSRFHYNLSLLYENGSKILDSFTNYNKGKNIDIDEIKILLFGQNYLIPQLLSFFENDDVQTVFSIKVPEIKPLQFLLFEKGFRIKFYLGEIEENERRYSDGNRIERIRYPARVELPDQESVEKSKKELEKINVLTEKLRQFLVEHFEIEEII